MKNSRLRIDLFVIGLFAIPLIVTKAAFATVGLPSDSAATKAPQSEPFAFGDFTWLQGNNRQHVALLDSKYFTGTFTLDANYNYSFNRPIDHTNSGSTATFREGELNVSYIEFGGDFHHENARARLVLQFENWNYQPSYTSDNTPWFFAGVRVQTFPSDKLKLEYWLINGWQTYGMFNEVPGVGFRNRGLIDRNYFGSQPCRENRDRHDYVHWPLGAINDRAFSGRKTKSVTH